MKMDPEHQPLQSAQGRAGGIKADPEGQHLDAAQDKLPARPLRAAAAAGIAKRIQSEADDAMHEASAGQSRKDQTRKAPQIAAAHGEVAAARQLKQQKASKAGEVDGIRSRAATKPSARRAKRRGQAVQVYGLAHAPPANRMRMFGNFVGEAPQRFIICGENPSTWDRTTQRCVQSRSTQRRLPESANCEAT